MEIRIYFEGDPALKEGFHAFFGAIVSATREQSGRIRFIAGKARARDDFRRATRVHPDAWNVLLIDSEGEPDSNDRDGQTFWMVQCMESWFLADKDTLEAYYGERFRRNALPANPDVERIPKKDVIDGLAAATRQTGKGEYHKTRHAAQLLRLIRPDRVRSAAQNCERFFAAALARLASP